MVGLFPSLCLGVFWVSFGGSNRWRNRIISKSCIFVASQTEKKIPHAWKTHPQNTCVTIIPYSPVRSILWIINVNSYTAMSRSIVTKKPIANVSGARSILVGPTAIPANCLGPMVHRATAATTGAWRVNVCRAKVTCRNRSTVAGEPGVLGVPAVCPVAVACKRVSENATTLCPRVVANTVRELARNIVHVIPRIVQPVRWMPENSSAIRWMGDILV